MKTEEETEKGSMVAPRCASEEKNFLQTMPKQCHHEPENDERAKERRAKFGGGLILVDDPGERIFLIARHLENESCKFAWYVRSRRPTTRSVFNNLLKTLQISEICTEQI